MARTIGIPSETYIDAPLRQLARSPRRVARWRIRCCAVSVAVDIGDLPWTRSSGPAVPPAREHGRSDECFRLTDARRVCDALATFHASEVGSISAAPDERFRPPPAAGESARGSMGWIYAADPA